VFDTTLSGKAKFVQKMLKKSPAGDALLKGTIALLESEYFAEIAIIFQLDTIPEDERRTLQEIFSGFMQKSLDQAPAQFVLFLNNEIQRMRASPDPSKQHQARIYYYMRLLSAVGNLLENDKYNDFVNSVQAFEKDASPPALLARAEAEDIGPDGQKKIEKALASLNAPE